MACVNDTRFVLNKGLNNEFVLVIKQQGSVDPMEIDPADTFKVTVFEFGNSTEVGELTMAGTAQGTIEVESAINGKIKLVFEEAFVNTLATLRGGEVDRYYLKPTYRAAIECDTVGNGSFIAKIDKIYVE